MQPRLTRSRTDRMLAGVCGGLGTYFGIDPVIVRLIFVIIGLIPPFLALPVYVVLWLIMPQDRTDTPFRGYTPPPSAVPYTPPHYDDQTGQPLSTATPNTAGRNRTLGWVLTIVGAIALLNVVGGAIERIIGVSVTESLVPVLLIGAGVFLLRRRAG